MPEDTTVFLNDQEANRIYRICMRNGCTPEQADAIAIELGEVESQSFEGKIKKTITEKTLEFATTKLLPAFYGAIGVALTGAAVWFSGLIK